MEPKTPWMGEYIWEENKCDGSAPECVPLPDEVVAMFRPSKCLLCGTVTSNQQSAFTHYESKGHFKKVAQHMREKYNVLGTLKSREKFRPVRCEICQIDITSRVVLMQHYDGKQHLKNLKKKVGDGAPVITETKETADTPAAVGDGDFENPMDFIKDLPPPPPLPKLGIYFCSLCQIKSKSKGQMEIHNTGSRHLKNLSKLADGELKEFFLRNGNCEPVEVEAQDSTPPSTPTRDSQVDNQFPQPSTPAPGGFPYPPVMDSSMGMPMVPNMPPPYTQMPYNQYPQYPQYPQGYDYNAWNQGQHNYNAGQPPYGNYNAPQQPYGQPMYNPGPYPNPYPNNQQYPGNQQAYPTTQPSFLSAPPPFISAPQNQNDPCPAAPGTTDTLLENPNTSSMHPEAATNHQNTPSSDKAAKAISDSFWSRKWGGSTPPKEPEVRESPVPDDFEIKPLAVSNFIKLLAKEAKLEKESSGSSANTHANVEKTDCCEEAENTGEGDFSNTTIGMEPKNEAPSVTVESDESAGDKVGSESIEVTDLPVDDERGVGLTNLPSDKALNASEEVVIHDQDEINDDSSIDKTSKISIDDDKGEEENEKNPNPIMTHKEESDKSPESPFRNSKEDPDQDAKFIDVGVSESNVSVQKSVAPSVSNATKTSTDAFSFKIGGKPTVSFPRMSAVFRRSTEKMFKDAKEKKKLEELKKLKERAEVNVRESPLVEKIGVEQQLPKTVEQTREVINAQSPKQVESAAKPPEDNDSKNRDVEKLDKSDGEITDEPGDLAGTIKEGVGSSESVSDSLPVLKDGNLARNSEDRVDYKEELENKNSNKEEQKIQDDTPTMPDSSSDKRKSRTKKFSASDKKKVSRTRNSSSDTSRKSRSRSRSHHKRSKRRRSSSWSPSSEDELNNSFQGKNDNYRQDNFQNYYGYNNRNRNWRNNRGYYQNNRGFHQRNYWDHQRYSGWENQDEYNERHREETDEFGREKRRREDRKKEKRESRKRKKERKSPSAASSASRSSSGSRSRSKKKRSKSDKKPKSSKKHPVPSPDIKIKKTVETPEVPKERIIAAMSPVDAKQTPLTLAQKLRLEKSDQTRNTPSVERKDQIMDEVELAVVDPVRRVRKESSPGLIDEKVQTVVVEQEAPLPKPVMPTKLLEVLEKEREKQEILKKMAFIKMSLHQKEKAKQDKKKKKKKEKSKKKKKKRSSSTSSSSSSSSSSSDSSLSSSSSSSSSQSESLAEKLLAKMKRDAKVPGPSSVLPDLAKVLLKKSEPEESAKKKKRKKNKKEKKKKAKKSRKAEPSQSSLASYITPSGAYFCKYCNVTFASGNSFIEHLISEKHKLLYKLVKGKAVG